MSPLAAPPASYSGTPCRRVVSAGRILTRIHSIDFGPTQFNPNFVSDESEGLGSRFDSTPDDPYPFLYAAAGDGTAVSEALLRYGERDDTGARILPRALIGEKMISWIEPQRDLELVDLSTGPCLGAIGADSALTTSTEEQYNMTRRWSAWIRQKTEDDPHSAQGLIWRSLREPAGYAFVFFEDRCPPEPFKIRTVGMPLPAAGRRIDHGEGRDFLEKTLKDYNAALAPAPSDASFQYDVP